MKNKAVVLGANYYIGLSIIRCLGRHGVHVVAVDYAEEGAYGLRSRYISEKLIGPHYKREEKAFLQFLIDYAKKQSEKPVLFPSADQYVEFIDANFDELKKYYLFNQEEKGLFTRTMNKDTLAQMANELGTAVPETILADAPDLEARVENEVGFPCIVKPVDSAAFISVFRRKMFKVKNMDELRKAVVKSKEKNMEVFVQRIIPGFDDHMYTFDAYLNSDSKVTHWTTAHKLRQYPINFGASVYTEQLPVPELYDIGKPFLEGIGWKGFAEIEFKKDRDTGAYYLIEVNVRTTNFNEMLYKVGLNAPLLAYQELTGQAIGEKAITDKMNYTFWYMFEDMFAVMHYMRKRQLKFSEILPTYFRRKVHSTWAWDDPKPYLYFFKWKIVGRTLDKLLRRKK